jgi:3-oxoacyl-[acyl-carrier protein] reductase
MQINKIALISGGNKGIGLAISQKLLQNNYNVYSLSRTGTSMFAHNNFINIKNDITNKETTENAINEIIKKENNIDVVVHNSGITKDKFFHKMTYPEWFDVINTNLISSHNIISGPINNMRNNKNGNIIFISSVNGLTGMIGQSNYTASKCGLYALTKTLAQENAAKNIRVNCISPGYIYSDMTNTLNDKIKNNIKKQIPMNDFGKPEDIAETVEFILNNKYITGSNININGGLCMI